MLTEDGKHLYVSYDEYHDLIEKLAIQIHQSGWEFDTILCLARGGMRPGDVLSRIFDKPLAIMSTSSYRANAGTVQGHLDIAKYITTPRAELAGRVLLVDDILDEGHTMRAVKRWCEGQNARDVRVAVLCTKRHDRCVEGIHADYCGVDVPDRYVFGYGMDYREQGRNLPGIHALALAQD